MLVLMEMIGLGDNIVHQCLNLLRRRTIFNGSMHLLHQVIMVCSILRIAHV